MRPGVWWRQTAGGLPRPFWYVWAGTLVNRIGYFVEPFLALYLSKEKDFSATTVGVIIGCFGAGSFVSQPLGGYLADRVGRRMTLVLGMAGSAVGFMALVLAPTTAALGAAAALTGLAIDMYRPAVQAMVADLVSPADRTRAFGLIYWAINIGVASAGLLGGVLAEQAFWPLFVLDAITCLGFAVLIARGVPETRPERSAASPSGYGPALRDRLLLALSAIGLVGGVVYMQSFVTLPLSVAGDGLGPAAFGLIYAVNPVVVIILQPITLRWLISHSPVAVFGWSSVVLGVGFGLTAFAHNVPSYMATVAVWTLGEIAFNAVGPALLADIAPPDLRGRYNGVFGISFGASALLAPLIGTNVLEHFGREALWGGCLLAAIASAVGVWALGPALHRRRAAAHASAPVADAV